MNKEQHISELKGKFYADSEIEHAIRFKPSGTFSALSEAEVYLIELGYKTGILSGKKPIGFSSEIDNIEKWDVIPIDERSKLDGIIIPEHDFEEGGALILFFKPPKY